MLLSPLPMLTLERLALVQTAIQIVNDIEMEDLAMQEKLMALEHELMLLIEPEFELQPPSVEKDAWEQLVKEKMFSFQLPQTMHQNILGVCRALKLEITKWFKEHSVLRTLDFFPDFRRFIWKSYGKIDRAKTAHSLIRDENSDIKMRYMLACLHFYEEDVFALWKRMTRNDQDFISEHSYTDIAILEWTNIVKGEYPMDWDTVHFGARCYILGLPIIIKKMEQDDQILNIIIYLKKGYMSVEDIFQCLSQKEFRLCSKYLKCLPQFFLQHFLDWPFQDEFMKVANEGWGFLSEARFHDLLKDIIYERITMERDEFDYINLFKQFWTKSPAHFKDWVKEQPIFPAVMLVFNRDLPEFLLIEELLKFKKNAKLEKKMEHPNLLFTGTSSLLL